MKKQSVEVLDRADRMEDILNFQLFVAEQDARLWSMEPDDQGDTWEPGDPLVGWDFCSVAYARPMLERIDDLAGLPVRCVPCAVRWEGPEPCFVCGKKRRDPREAWRQMRDENPDPTLDVEEVGGRMIMYSADGGTPTIIEGGELTSMDFENIAPQPQEIGLGDLLHYVYLDVNTVAFIHEPE